MAYLLPSFKAVSVIFSFAAVGTGLQALIDPYGFSKSFGLPIVSSTAPQVKNGMPSSITNFADSYIRLMGVRQLGTGILLMIFNYQHKYIEAATVLAVIGVLVAGTDGLFLARAGDRKAGLFHAGPGLAIAALAGAVLYHHA
ncbi:unnamed protein product [Zymoseptoria tritici ST99CH_3D1]|uniref:DUF4267 domain-containing protein n=1 Tax=Zymoseptoria tritici (strain ST99CH_3D7) TaxID=1276538 RepID=A0A1X7S8Y9_ZYMT9|nr:unnamed protein product [Zymoseptoria tritici ST99CH_3D7]SMR64425.1 unnamed protein product [Zymoseptoria tritici ST99CH_3D1]